jgi:integrase
LAAVAKELSALEVGRIRAVGLHAVGGIAGLCLHVTPSGARSWVLRVVIGGKRREMGLGAFPGVTLAGAREKARGARLQIEQGIDPIAEREQTASRLRAQQAAERTFEWCAAQYIEAHGDGWRNAKHRAQWSATLATYAYPVIGRVLVRDVDQPSVLAVLEPIWRTKTETAARLRGRIETVLDWARVRGYRNGENPARWKGHLDKLLPAPSKVQKTQHHRALPIDAVGNFMADLRQREGVSARALEFAILAAARSGEVRGAEWSEFDMAAKVWSVPAGRMKAGKEHRVPLSDQAVRLLNGLDRFADSTLVFSAARGGQLSDMSLTAVMRRMAVDAVPHGFRSTFRDWAGERTNYPRDLAEQALAHVLENKVEAAYRRGDALERRRGLMQHWSDFCDGAEAPGGQVVAMRTVK